MTYYYLTNLLSLVITSFCNYSVITLLLRIIIITYYYRFS